MFIFFSKEIFNMLLNRNNKIHRSGLCVIDRDTNEIVVVMREEPYPTRSIVRNKKMIFVEQFSLPRGKCIERSETLKQCALREFVEETRIFFKKYQFAKTHFDLYWYDPINIKWEYRIYFAFASLSDENLIRVDRSLIIPNLDTIYIRRKDIKYEPMKPIFIKIINYIELVTKRLSLYGNNNYVEFLNVLQNIQQKTNNTTDLVEREIFLAKKF